ncbi:hypothetical protein [Butyricimonas sp. Marseille-P3923]|uniref:hypothetical protein n=1 Tax=Butyricimonas sp. Marseille-P3923 TaxID=1987504 RepID=UPI000C08BF1F|nr:hypothetical protein [Butyricimonas sp. Marseille-P3923]
MKMEDLMNNILRGKRGNLIIYKRGETWCARRVAIPGKKRAWEVNGHSMKKQGAITRFTAVQAFYKAYGLSVSPVIWRLAGREEGMLPHNLFLKENYACFDTMGMLVDFEGLRFSTGKLLLPRNIKIDRDGEWFRVTWEDERDWDKAAGSDRLRVGVIYDDKPLSPRVALEVSGARGNKEGVFRLNESVGRSAHVYVFFERADGEGFSRCRYFRVK